MTEIM